MGKGGRGSWQNVDLQFFLPPFYILHKNLAKNLHLQKLLTKLINIWGNLQYKYKIRNIYNFNKSLIFFISTFSGFISTIYRFSSRKISDTNYKFLPRLICNLQRNYRPILQSTIGPHPPSLWMTIWKIYPVHGFWSQILSHYVYLHK